MNENVRRTIENFNELLRDIYVCDMRISHILHNNGLSAEQIALVKDQFEKLYDNIEFALQCKFLGFTNNARLYDIICRRYGVFGHKKQTLQSIADEYVLSRERIRQLEERAIRQLKPTRQKDYFGKLITLSACRILGINPQTVITTQIEVDTV